MGVEPRKYIKNPHINDVVISYDYKQKNDNTLVDN